jgi:hypothetical protein
VRISENPFYEVGKTTDDGAATVRNRRTGAYGTPYAAPYARCNIPLLCVCFPRPPRGREGLVHGDQTTVVGILGDDPLTSRILALLLESAGYGTRALEVDAVLDDPGASLEGIDLLLCMPPPDDQREDELLDAVEGGPWTAAVPVLRLSTEPKAQRTDSVLPWPWSMEALVGAIERALRAPGGGEVP